jgi:hypothetical protein
LAGQHCEELDDDAVSHDRDIEPGELRDITAGFDQLKFEVTKAIA